MTILTEKKFSLNLLTIIIAAIIFLTILFGGFMIYNSKVNKLNSQIDLEVKLRNALIDSVKYYTNSRNEVVAEKLTLQADIKTLSGINNKLSQNQKELLDRVKEVEKEKSIIAAALIESNVLVDSLRNATNVNVDTVKNNITFSDSTKNIKYKIIISKVKPLSSTIKPELKINELIMPNKTFISFSWGERKEGYPISFSVSNSNPYFKTVNIDSYAIPQLDKKVIAPTGWDKFKNFFKKSSNTFITVGIGVVAGAGITYILLK